MGNKKYAYFRVFFFIIVSTALAFNVVSENESTLFAPPTVNFTFNTNACSGETVSFVSTVTGDGPFDYAWDFGDGSTSTQQNPNHVFQALGCGTQNFNVSLVVSDDNGLSTTVNHTITIIESPDISFIDTNPGLAGPFNNCGNTNSSSEFLVEVDNVSVSSSCVSSYNISWGDGMNEANVSFPISHNYVGFGTYNMNITAIGDNGCSNTVTYVVKNATNPSGGISGPGNTQNLCAPSDDIQFEITNWGTNTSDTTYEVDYGDGTIVTYTQADLVSSAFYNAGDPASSLPFPILPHSYTESSCPDEFVARLWIRNACAPNPNPATLPNILIIISPEASFNVPDINCVDVATQFINNTEPGFGFNCSSNVNFTWDFGDGSSPVITTGYENVNHIFTSTGTYTVTLSGDNFSCDESDYSQVVCIEPPLNPTFTSTNNEDCAPFSTVLNNTTILTDQCDVPTYDWVINYTASFCGTTSGANFINGTDSNSENPNIEFINPGTYELVLQATNSCGTSSSAPQEIIVKAPPVVSINDIDDFCETSSIITPSATVDNCGPSVTYNWSIDIGSSPIDWEFVNGTNVNSELPEIEFYTADTYILSLEVTNSCGTTIDDEDFILSPVPSITNTMFEQTICSGADTVAIDLMSDITATTYTWSSNSPAGLTGYLPSGSTDQIPVQTLINTTNASITLIYSVTPQIGNCIGAPVDFEIIVEPAPIITVQPIPDEVCLNGTTPDLTVSYQGSGTPIYQWYENTVDNTSTGTAIAGASMQTFSPPTDMVGDTYYYIIITFSTGGCNEIISDTALIEVKEVSQIDTQPTNTQSFCVGGLAEELSVLVSGGAGVPTYQWYSNTTNSNSGGTLVPGATNATFTPPIFMVSGTYYFYVEVNYGASGCSNLISDIAQVIVVDDPIVTTQPEAFQSLCQNTIPNNLEVTISNGLGNISYQWYVNTTNTNAGGTLIAGATSNVFTPSTTAVGTLFYYCIITQDVSGCEVTSLLGEVEVTAAAQFTSQPLSDELCLGETTADLVVSYTNGTGTPTYQWFENTINDVTSGTPITGETSSSYSPMVNTVGTMYYYCIITLSSGGCSEIISEVSEIIINETPSISNADFLICSDNTFEYIPDASNGDIVPVNTTYTWTTPIVNPAGSITGAMEQLINTTSISQLLINTTTNPATATYTITPTSGDCVGADFEVVVTVNPSISVTAISTHNDCYESNNASIDITIVGGVPFTNGNAYNITWTGPNGFSSTDEDIFNLEAGNYTLNIEDDGGCPYSELFTIIEPEELVFGAIDFDPETISCFNANDGSIGVSVEGGTLPYTYSWTLNGLPFSSDEDVSNLGPGTYEISATDFNNCGPITQSFIIVEPSLLEVALDTQTNVLCFGESTGNITVNTNGGRPGYSFSWTGPNGFTSSNQNIDNISAGTYQIEVTDASNCTDTLEVVIIQNDEITIDVTATEIECYGDNDASITINNIAGGVSPYSIAWSNFGTGYSQTNLSGGIYTITITDAEDCSRSFPIVIDEPPLFLIDPIVTQMSCSGENDASIVLNFQGGIDPVTVVWDDDPSAGVERNNLAPGSYSVTITDGKPCTIQDSFTIFNILPLEVSANVTNALDCDEANSGAINLLIEGGTPPFSVTWSNGATTENLDNIPPNNYTVIVTDANGCEIEGNWDVDRFEPLVLEVDTQSEVDCEAKTVNQTFVALASGGVPPFMFNWSSGTVSGLNNELMTTDENGLVILEVTDSMGCTTNFSFNVETPVLGDPDFDVDSFGSVNYGIFAIQDPIQFTNTATGDYVSVLWDFGDGSFSGEENPIHTYLQVGNYVVTQTVTYPFGCVYTNIVTLIVEKGYKLIMPDAFTPNEDGLNDYFGPEYIGLNQLEINIYDTWGSLVYSESGDDIRGWDGKINDEEAENGNYYYTFKASTFYEDLIEKQGAFVFIK